MMADSLDNAIREVISQLQAAPPDLSSLLPLLCSPLAFLGLLPPQYIRYNKSPLADGTLRNSRHVPTLQRVLLEHVIPTWEDVLSDDGKLQLVDQYFCPDAFSNASVTAGEVALSAYSTILSLPLMAYSIKLLVNLSKEYPIDRLYRAIFIQANNPSFKQTSDWDDCIRNIVAVPSKVANSLRGQNIPPELEHGRYFNSVSLHCEELMFVVSKRTSPSGISALSQLLSRLVSLGIFPSQRPAMPTQPSFFRSTTSNIRQRLMTPETGYSNLWIEVFDNLPSIFMVQAIFASLLASLADPASRSSNYLLHKSLVKQEAMLLLGLVGQPGADRKELWDIVSAVILGHEWDEIHARIVVCWVSGCRSDVDEQALSVLLDRIVDMWSSADHVKHSLLSQHRYLTLLLLITVSYFPPPSPQVKSLALSPLFISGVGKYIGHLDHAVRRCGMLAAEIVAGRAGKQLDFGDWDGDEDGKQWARDVRKLLEARDVDIGVDVRDSEEPFPQEVAADVQVDAHAPLNDDLRSKILPSVTEAYDSDDSLTGYASISSSRSPSPTPSELAEVEQDPSLNIGVKKVPRPVYLAQLGEMLRSTGGQKSVDDSNDADKIETALNCAEELIRKKRYYGTELEENAINLVYALIGLNNNFDFQDFDAKRQGAVNALVACCPRKAALSLIEEFFKNQYSTDQRYVILNALALGARELASLTLSGSATSPLISQRIAFPSRTLPAPLHQTYLSAGNQTLVQITGALIHSAIESGKDSAAEKVPNVVRERRLRITKPARVSEVDTSRRLQKLPEHQYIHQTTYTEVAAEYFVIPFINRFWMFFRDEQTREQRTSHLEGRHRYRGAGTGLILNPLVLSHFLTTMTILVHASQNAPEWLSVIAPDALELAVTLGARPISEPEDEDEAPREGSPDSDKSRQAAVLSTSLELVLIILDGCIEADGGRSLGLDHTSLLLSIGEWAGTVFSHMESGIKIMGGGGSHEIRLKRAVAGVLLKVDDITSKWKRSIIDSMKML